MRDLPPHLAALDRELDRSAETMMEVQGMLLLVAHYIRDQATCDVRSTSEEADHVAFTIEKFGARLFIENLDLSKAGGWVGQLHMVLTSPRAPRRPRTK